MLTLGLGFLSAQWLALILGVTAYTLGWIYLPDLPFFRKWVDRRREEVKRSSALAEVAAFKQRRQSLLASLSPSRCERYNALVAEFNGLTAQSNVADARLREIPDEVKEAADEMRRYIEAFRDFERLCDAGFFPLGVAVTPNKDAEVMFTQGEIAMAMNGSWAVDVYGTMNPHLEFGVFPFPSSDHRSVWVDVRVRGR